MSDPKFHMGLHPLHAQRVAQIEQRALRWRQLLHETGADKLEGDVRAQLLLWRSGRGVNSVIVDTYAHLNSTPFVLSEAIWRLNEDFDAIMVLEGARVNVPAPVPPSLGRTLHPGIDVAGLFIWDGFVNPKEDTWRGLLWECYVWDLKHRPPLIKADAELHRAIEERDAKEAAWAERDRGRKP